MKHPMKRPPRVVEKLAPKIITRPLSKQERDFVNAYDGGDPYEAVVAAGYTGNEYALIAQGERLLAIPAVRRAVRAKAGYSPDLLEELDIKEALARIAMGQYETKDRLKALELLGKNKAMWVEKVQHEGADLATILAASFTVNVGGEKK